MTIGLNRQQAFAEIQRRQSAGQRITNSTGRNAGTALEESILDTMAEMEPSPQGYVIQHVCEPTTNSAAANRNRRPVARRSRFATVDVLTPQLESLAKAIDRSDLSLDQIAKRSGTTTTEQLQSFLDGDPDALKPADVARVRQVLDVIASINNKARKIRGNTSARITGNLKTQRNRNAKKKKP